MSDINTETSLEALQNDVLQLQADADEDRIAVREAIVGVKAGVVDLQGKLVDHAREGALSHAELQKSLKELDEKLALRLKWSKAAKAAGTFLGGALVALVPAQSAKVAEIVGKILELIP